MNSNLLIVFVKNIKLGTVKTRLAKSIGDAGAFEVYKYLVEITEKATKGVDVDVHIYFSDVVIDSKWPESKKYVQEGHDLGERMQNAFNKGFKNGYEKIVIIGSDLPELTSDVINEGFENLSENDVVLGPAKDGGYYLLGLTQMIDSIFTDKAWSTSTLFDDTLADLTDKKVSLLTSMNDLDTVEDLQSSTIFEEFRHLI